MLAEDLAPRLPAGAVILADAPALSSAPHLVVTIAKFGGGQNRQLKPEGSWGLLEDDPAKALPRRDINFSSKASHSSYEAQAAATSRLLGSSPTKSRATCLLAPKLSSKGGATPLS